MKIGDLLRILHDAQSCDPDAEVSMVLDDTKIHLELTPSESFKENYANISWLTDTTSLWTVNL